MRIGKKSRARRALAFYRCAYGIKQPFRVVVDGTALQAAANLKVDLREELPKLLGGQVEVMVTRAVVAELRQLGKEFKSATAMAKRLPKLDATTSSQPGAASESVRAQPRLASPRPLPPSSPRARPALPRHTGLTLDQITCAVSDGNPRKLCVMTEDASLQAQIVRQPGVPLLRFSRQNLILEPPTRESKTTAETTTEELARVQTVPSKATEPDHESARPTQKKRKFGPKEPNPLSRLRKKKKVTAPPPAPAEVGSKKRRRRRSGTGSATASTA
jgi:U3 small nucleolar RNA-associated protein 23